MVLDGLSPRSRSTDPVTSVDAGRSADLSGSQLSVLIALESFGPLADHELVELNAATRGSVPAYSPQRIRSARAELVEQGRVEFSGIFRLTPSGHRARVWMVTPPE